tara:strand:- start:341 stop:448 length:108 start_codon:yes stop_codon:yes gene_type:complete
MILMGDISPSRLVWLYLLHFVHFRTFVVFDRLIRL